MPDAADATAALSASQTTPTTGAYFFYGFSIFGTHDTHLASLSSTAQGREPGTMGTAVGETRNNKKAGSPGRPETGSPGRGPKSGFQVHQEGSSSPFLYSRLWERAVEGARRGAGVGAIAGRRGRAPANSGGTGGPEWRGFRRNLGVSAKNKFFSRCPIFTFFRCISI